MPGRPSTALIRSIAASNTSTAESSPRLTFPAIVCADESINDMILFQLCMGDIGDDDIAIFHLGCLREDLIRVLAGFPPIFP